MLCYYNDLQLYKALPCATPPLSYIVFKHLIGNWLSDNCYIKTRYFHSQPCTRLWCLLHVWERFEFYTFKSTWKLVVHYYFVIINLLVNNRYRCIIFLDLTTMHVYLLAILVTMLTGSLVIVAMVMMAGVMCTSPPAEERPACTY